MRSISLERERQSNTKQALNRERRENLDHACVVIENIHNHIKAFIAKMVLLKLIGFVLFRAVPDLHRISIYLLSVWMCTKFPVLVTSCIIVVACYNEGINIDTLLLTKAHSLCEDGLCVCYVLWVLTDA